jgi:hypothetical protein
MSLFVKYQEINEMSKYITLKIGVTLAFLPAVAAGAEIINQASNDVMVLRAEVVGTIASSGPSDIVMSRCAPRRDATGLRWLDCTSAIADKYGAPAIHGMILPADGTAKCTIMRIKTISKQLAAVSSEGIGFSHGQKNQTNRVSFVALNRLSKVVEMKLVNGTVGEVHQFVAISSCENGAVKVSYQFRPFLGYQTSTGSKFRNWDSFGFYEIPKDKTGFDQTVLINKRVTEAPILESTTSTGEREVFSGDSSAHSGADQFLYGE